MRLSDKVEWSREEGKNFLISFESGKLFSLNETASRIVELIGEGNGTNEILYSLGNEFDVDKEKLTLIVNNFITHLEGEGIIIRGDKN